MWSPETEGTNLVMGKKYSVESYFMNSPRKRKFCSSKQRPWLQGCGGASCSLLIAVTISVSARVQDSHAGWAVIIPSLIRATLGRDSESRLVCSRGWNSTKIHPFSSAPEHSEAADTSLCQGEARYFWTVKQQLSRHTWTGGIRLLWWKVGTMCGSKPKCVLELTSWPQL